MPYIDTGGGGNQQVHHSQTVHRKATPKARPAPAPYNPPPAPPVYSNSSGQYSGGGGSPHPAHNGNSMGRVHPAGNPGPSPEQRRQQRIQARQDRMQEKRQEARQERKHDQQVKQKTNKFRNFLSNDETYQDQLNSLTKEMQDYVLSNKDQRSRARQDFSLAKNRMGQERGNALEDMKNDFAARGLLNSSEFADALGKYNTQYNQQLGDLSTNQSRSIADLLESLGLYRNQNTNERQAARQEAIRRRTQQFGGWEPGDG